MNCDRPDRAHKVIEAQTPKLAKQIATELKGRISPDHIRKWLSKRILVMENALKLKWNACAKFRHAFMQTSGSTIAEATQDTFWGVGVLELSRFVELLKSTTNSRHNIICGCVCSRAGQRGE